MFQDRIRACYGDLTPSFKTLADFILENTTEAAFLTVMELSKVVGVDPATIVRFAQELGYSGYRELLRDIKGYVLAQITKSRREFAEADSDEHLEARLLKLTEQDLHKFAAADLVHFSDIIMALQQSRHIWITGEHMSYDIAAFLEKAFAIIGIPSTCFIPDKSATANALMQMQPGDALLGIVSIDSGSNVGIAVQGAKEIGINTIVISGSSVILAAREAEISMIIPIRNVEGIPSFSFLFLITALLWESLAHQERDKSVASLVAYREQLRQLSG